MRDKYDSAVDFLTAHPEEIKEAWAGPNLHPAGCLFYLTDTTSENVRGLYGCLTQVKSGIREAPTPELTTAIRQDPNIPADETEIKVKHLGHFAKWQRKIDQLGIRD